MNRVSAFIDGFNLYHALIQDDRFKKFKWLNLRKLISIFISTNEVLKDVFYFTALANWNRDKVARHELFIQAQEAFGVHPIYGKFKEVYKYCLASCKQKYKTYEEKQTDVNIAIKLFEQAKLDTYDRAIILSGDSDQVPAIQAIKEHFPTKRISILVPPGRHADELKHEANSCLKIKYKNLEYARLPDEVKLADGTTIYCPDSWKPSNVVSSSSNTP
ncbi:hypothetical protein R80B4_03281 [Fibrobacteres bacterium R8-0-B4]